MFYNQRLLAVWNNFGKFCHLHDMLSLQATRSVMLTYLVWTDIDVATVKSLLVLMAISHYHESCDFKNPIKDYSIRRLARVLIKALSSEKEAFWQCDLFSVEALRHYINNLLFGVSPFIFARLCPDSCWSKHNVDD
jgi:hypothetical protein